MPIATMDELIAEPEIEIDGSVWTRSEDGTWASASGARVRPEAFLASLRASKVNRPGEWDPDATRSYYESREMYLPIRADGDRNWLVGHFNGSYGTATFVGIESIEKNRLRGMNNHERRVSFDPQVLFTDIDNLRAEVARTANGTRVTDALVEALRTEAENSESLSAVLRAHGLDERKGTVTVKCKGTLPPSQVSVGEGITVTASVPWAFDYTYETEVSYEVPCACGTFVEAMAQDRAPKGHTGFVAEVSCSMPGHVVTRAA